MCARDPSQTASASQTKSFLSIKEMFSYSPNPVCIRNNTGSFIYQNNIFNKEMLNDEVDVNLWFSNLPLDISILLSQTEIEMFIHTDLVFILNELCIGNRYWTIHFQTILFEDDVYSVWIFYSSLLVVSQKSNQNFFCKAFDHQIYDYRNQKKLVQWNALNLHLAGLTHEAISKLLSISVGSSKNYITDSHDFFKISSRDDLILLIYSNNTYLQINENVKNILKRNVNKLLSKQ